MSGQPLRDAAYATMALHQRLSLDEIAAGVPTGTFPARDIQAPNWFAAAAGSGSRLAEVAPELAAEGAPAVASGLDLIRMYAPELQGDLDEAVVEPDVPTPPQDTRLRLELLQELADLDE